MTKRKKKKVKTSPSKPRDWNTVSAIQRTSAGPMRDKKRYARKPKHKGKVNENS